MTLAHPRKLMLAGIAAATFAAIWLLTAPSRAHGYHGGHGGGGSLELLPVLGIGGAAVLVIGGIAAAIFYDARRNAPRPKERAKDSPSAGSGTSAKPPPRKRRKKSGRTRRKAGRSKGR